MMSFHNHIKIISKRQILPRGGRFELLSILSSSFHIDTVLLANLRLNNETSDSIRPQDSFRFVQGVNPHSRPIA